MEYNAYEQDLEIEGFVSLVGDVVTVEVMVAAPPGARVKVVARGVELHGKVVAIKKAADGRFALNVRINPISKAQRAVLS